MPTFSFSSSFHCLLAIPIFRYIILTSMKCHAGGAHCLSILNTIFAVVFSLLSFFLGLIIQLLGSSCSLPLFWCYEVTSLGLVILYGGTAFFLRRKAALVLAEANFSDQEFGLEMCEAPHEVVTPDMEKCMNEGSKPPRLWRGLLFYPQLKIGLNNKEACPILTIACIHHDEDSLCDQVIWTLLDYSA